MSAFLVENALELGFFRANSLGMLHEYPLFMQSEMASMMTNSDSPEKHLS
jgi:hypothetical protein